MTLPDSLLLPNYVFCYLTRYSKVRKIWSPFGSTVSTKKLSISLPASLVQFIESYKLAKGCKSRSQVIEAALELLRNQELEEAYRLACSEVDADWDTTVGNGLAHETW